MFDTTLLAPAPPPPPANDTGVQPIPTSALQASRWLENILHKSCSAEFGGSPVVQRRSLRSGLATMPTCRQRERSNSAPTSTVPPAHWHGWSSREAAWH
eukprot:289973-Rhodomonas_salina.2